jgi:hypothetical protein
MLCFMKSWMCAWITSVYLSFTVSCSMALVGIAKETCWSFGDCCVECAREVFVFIYTATVDFGSDCNCCILLLILFFSYNCNDLCYSLPSAGQYSLVETIDGRLCLRKLHHWHFSVGCVSVIVQWDWCIAVMGLFCRTISHLVSFSLCLLFDRFYFDRLFVFFNLFFLWL